MVFGRKKGVGKTVAIVDIENGSVAAALALLSRGNAPRLMGEIRIPLPITTTRDTAGLARHTEEALRTAVAHVSDVASRLRAHNTLPGAGEIAHVAGFFSIPWASMCMEGDTADFVPHMADIFRYGTQGTLGNNSTSLHPYGAAALHGASTMLQLDAPVIVCIVGGEATELLVLADKTLKARATLPHGLHTLLRTLVSHGGVSPEEARSYLKLVGHSPQHRLTEALAHAQEHFAGEFVDVVPQLLAVAQAESILVLAPHPAEEWFGRALTDTDALAGLFPEGSTVRSLRAAHAQPYMGSCGIKPDFPLMLEALFVDKKFRMGV